jgi:hypothetical protein
MTVKWYHRTTSFAFGLCVAALGLASLQAIAAPDARPPSDNTGSARVWFLRPLDSISGNVMGAAPEVYANGAPVAALPAGTKFYRDLPAGTYQFTVQPYGQPTGAADTVRLTPGSETYLQVQWVPTWEEGYPDGRGLDSHSFFVLTMSPQLARAYLPTLTYLGQR